jgi:hypothetical protein
MSARDLLPGARFDIAEFAGEEGFRSTFDLAVGDV